MQTKSDSGTHTPRTPARQEIVTVLRLGGGISFWVQLGLAAVSVLRKENIGFVVSC